MQKFCHLHTHSHFSLLNALPKIPELISRAKKDKMEALALTDNGNLYGAIEFYKECKKQEIQPIIGVDFYVSARTRFDKEPRIDSKRSRLVLLVKNQKGYKNLLKLVTYSYIEGFYYKPRIDKELLEKYSEGLVAISPIFSGEIAQALKGLNEEKALEWKDFYQKIFKDDFYLELTRHAEIEGQEELENKIINFSKKNNIQLVASHDVYYLNPEDKTARNTLVSIAGNFGTRQDNDEGDFSFIDQVKACKLFKGHEDALENTQKIAEKCKFELTLGKWHFPNIEKDEGKTYDETLRKIVMEGFKKRGVEETEENLKRVNYELGIIEKKGYAPYFLVVADLLRYAKENGILSNIRGSVSGSMVTYLSGITNINPLEYQIPFERFLNPDRPSAPDIDMDFADNRRDEMVTYATKKYGKDKVAQIGTFGTMAARGSVRDVARALGYPVATGDRIAKMIPMGSQGFPMTIERALKENSDLKEAYKKEEDTKKIIDMAQKIEGCARHISVHAAGVVISPIPLIDIVPLQFDPKGGEKIITQYDMYSIDEENAGLLKFDFLGLKNLSIIADTLKLAEKLSGIKYTLDSIPIDDKKTFEMLARGETSDVFQLNGEGMTKFLVDLKPTSIHDINAMVALYRPGPIQFIPEYIERKHNPSKITYLDKALEPILEKTYGILVYQDDLLMMAHNLAGYSWGEVDKFRKAVGKKIPEEMVKQKEKFIQGCIEHSKWPQKKAEELWTWIEPFAAYGFNKAHSVSYGRVAYITAFLKANFPALYMASVLTHESGDVDKVSSTIAECKRMGIKVLPPDVNESFAPFTVITEKDNSQSIRFGLGSIKNFGEGISKTIIEERKRNGKFSSIEDFLTRIEDKNLNKRSLEALIKSGCFDNLEDRAKLLGNLESLLSYNKESKNNKNQNSLFGGESGRAPLTLGEVENLSENQKLSWEKELLGLYISGHPLNKFKEKLERKNISIKNILETAKEGSAQMVVGVLQDKKEIRTKKGDLMAFLKIADFNNTIEVVVFPNTYKEFGKKITGDVCLAIEGKISKKNDTPSLIADKIKII